jgi:hypothetical protein
MRINNKIKVHIWLVKITYTYKNVKKIERNRKRNMTIKALGIRWKPEDKQE